jgi:EmrB/QacA subfamily drug resistance transporter
MPRQDPGTSEAAAPQDGPGQAGSERQRRFVLAATVLASAMAFIDGSVVTMALPVMQDQLQATFQELQWIVNAYTLMLGALILVGGALGDRLGRKRIFTIGIVIFAIASLVCAVATSAAILIAARAVQGIGAALLVPQSLAIIAASFPREVRGRAIGVWAAASAITTSLGPPIGGFLIDLWSWRVAFLINLPLSAGALWLTFAHVPESRDKKPSGRLDWLGSALVVASLGAITYGLTALPERSASAALIAAAFLFGALGLLAFWQVEHRAENPTLPLSLFRSRPFLVTNIVTLFLYGALAGVLFLLPFDLIGRRGMAASTVGLTLLPFGLIIGLLSRPVGGLADRHGARGFLVGGSLVVASAAAVLALNLEGYWVGVFAPLILMALGMAAVVSPLTTTVMNSAPDERSGAASGINNAASRLAGLVAVAVLGAIAGLIFVGMGAPRDARFGTLPAAGESARGTLEQAFLAAYSGAMAVAAVWAALAAAAALLWLKREECKASREPSVA